MIIPISETITDLPVVGEVYSVPSTSASAKLRYLDSIRFFKLDKTGQTSDVSTVLNASTTTAISFDTIQVGDQLIAVIPVGTSVSKLIARCAVAGSGFTLNYKYWSTDNTYKPLTVTGGSTFLKSNGLSEMEFTTPSDMSSLPIGLPNETFFGKPIYIEVATVTTPVSPTIEQVYPVNATYGLVDITDGLKSLGISVLATSAFPVDGDTLCFGLDRKFSSIETHIWQARVGGTREYTYYDASGNEKALTVTDPTNGWTRKNEQTGTPVTFTSTSTNGSASTTQGIQSYGVVYATVSTLPTAATHKKAIGLSKTKTGNIDYELRVDFTGGNPRLTVYESGVLKYTDTVDLLVTDIYTVLRERHHDNTTKIYYVKNNVLLYTSTITSNSGVLYGRVKGIDSGAVVKNFLVGDATEQDTKFVTITLDNVVSGTTVNEAIVTRELPYRRNVTFTPPQDWTVNNSSNTPTGASGANHYHVCTKLKGTGEIMGAVTSHALLVPTSGTGVSGLTTKGISTATKIGLRVVNTDSLSNDMTLTITNVNTQLSTSATFVKGKVYQEVTIPSFSISDGHSIVVSKTSGDEEVVVGIGSYINIK